MKKYSKPSTTIVNVETNAILAGSTNILGDTDGSDIIQGAKYVYDEDWDDEEY